MEHSQRSDLAAEIIQLKKISQKNGLETEEYTADGIYINKVSVKTDEASESLGKPRGTYITVDLSGAFSSDETHTRAVEAVAEQLSSLIGKDLSKNAMVVGLGNSALTSDAIGPQAVAGVIVTRHLKHNLPDIFSAMPLRETSAFLPGVLGKTGAESAETVKAVADVIKPSVLIIIDALASRRTDRLCSTVQISDTGICPGSGVGNDRREISEKTVGVPVIAIGIPTVVDAATLALDIFEEVSERLSQSESDKNGSDEKTAGMFNIFENVRDKADEIIRTVLKQNGSVANMVVTPRDIDVIVKKSARLLSIALNKALHGELEQEEINALLG